MHRTLLREIRDYPVTLAVCTVWVVVYLAMFASSLHDGRPLTVRGVLLGTCDGHRFGSMTLAELAHGEVWRALTSTFVHFGIIHLAFNLYGMYLLGTLVESWYGRAQFLALYVVIGAGGNLLSGLLRTCAETVAQHLRFAFRTNPYVHSGGGSTVVLGLVALCAVAGWRARSRVGDYLRGQMIKVLVLTAVLGFLPIIDNWGHAGGALVGAAIGLAHRFLHRNQGRLSARWAGTLAGVVLVGCAGAQYLDDRAEAPLRARVRLDACDRTLQLLREVQRDYWTATLPLRKGRLLLTPRQALWALPQAQQRLAQVAASLDRRPTAKDYRRLRNLMEAALNEPPKVADAQEFAAVLRRLQTQALRERDSALREFLALDSSRRSKWRTWRKM
jgi:membrane associated rhomboid family serine protease